MEWVMPLPKLILREELDIVRKMSSTTHYYKSVKLFFVNGLQNKSVSRFTFTGSSARRSWVPSFCWWPYGRGRDESGKKSCCGLGERFFNNQTITIWKFIKMGVRSSYINILITFFEERHMTINLVQKNQVCTHSLGHNPRAIGKARLLLKLQVVTILTMLTKATDIGFIMS